MTTTSAPTPLVVDMDGTLIRTDLLHESALALLRQSFWAALRIPLWLLRGKAAMKAEIARRVTIDPAALPYNQPLLDWLRVQKAQGRRLILATASDHHLAERVAAHLGLFDAVWASDGSTNLAGAAKRAKLDAELGPRGYSYAGNSSADLHVWRGAASAVVVDAPAALLRAAQALTPIEHVEPRRPAGLRTWLKALRLHQWLKNLLIFLPPLAAHQFGNPSLWLVMATAFVAFGLTASSVYILNDLLDLADDRHHHRKRNRPFAAGTIPLLHGVLATPVLLAGAVLLCLWLPWQFALVLAAYYALTLAYSFWLKREAVIDVIALAMLYTVRILAGAAAMHVVPSFWLLAFSMSLFLSLALLKRYAELDHLRRSAGDTPQEKAQMVRGRGYTVDDLDLLRSMGTATGYSSVL
ncbi:MAG TPA: UbiA family prenyltransferase, partial [Burkholderiaceae bacterium]